MRTRQIRKGSIKAREQVRGCRVWLLMHGSIEYLCVWRGIGGGNMLVSELRKGSMKAREKVSVGLHSFHLG